MFEDLTKEEVEQLLAEYIATAQNPEYGGDMNIVNSKFPEFKDIDKQLLAEYIATAQNPEYGGDMNIVNSKFPEFFSELKKKEDIASVGESGMQDGSQQIDLDAFFAPQPEMFEMQREETLAAPSKKIVEDVVTYVGIEEGKRLKKETEKLQQKERLERIKDLERIKEESSELQDFLSSPEFKTDLDAITEDFTKRTEEEVIKDASKRYGKYGFVFEPARFGEKMIVRTTDGANKIEVKLDIDSEDSQKLKRFIQRHSKIPETADEDYISKSIKVRQSRDIPMQN